MHVLFAIEIHIERAIGSVFHWSDVQPESLLPGEKGDIAASHCILANHIASFWGLMNIQFNRAVPR